MTATNQYSPFATGDGALVLDPVTYATLPAVHTGYEVGVADPATLNTTWRQASMGVASLAQFIINQTGTSMLDDGNVSNFASALAAAIQAMIPAVPTLPTIPAPAAHGGADTSSSAATITASVVPAITSYAAGHLYAIKAAHACPGGTVNANLNTVGNRSVLRCDGSALETNDWASGDPLLLEDDGANLRLVGLTKIQAGELAAASTSITNIIAKNSDAGLTSLTAFTANNVGVSDVAQVPNFTLIQSTGFFHGATAIRVNGSGAIRNNTSANGTAGATLRWGLYDASTSSVVAYAPYLGGGVPITGAQVAYTVPEHVFQGLNPAHSYCIQMLAQKGTSDGAELAFDTSIDALHNGVNS